MSETPPLVSGGFVEVPAPLVPFGGSCDYMRMLREAQGVTSTVTSTRTSCRVSPYMSSHHSPKSPPNSPNNERSEYYGGDTDLRHELDKLLNIFSSNLSIVHENGTIKPQRMSDSLLQ